jgi:ABC-type transporter MlaC component
MARMRSDFSDTLRTGGADALIAILEKKIVELKTGA